MITVVFTVLSPSSVIFALTTHLLDDLDPTLEGFVTHHVRCYTKPTV
jgi:hypothetical protein